MNTITTNVYDNVGNNYISGVVVTHDCDVNNASLSSLKLRIVLKFHKSLEAKESGFTQIIPIESQENKVPRISFEQIITPEQAEIMSPVMVREFVTAKLTEWYGENVS